MSDQRDYAEEAYNRRTDTDDCDHVWVGGMCYIDPEDLDTVIASGRFIECERCDETINEPTE